MLESPPVKSPAYIQYSLRFAGLFILGLVLLASSNLPPGDRTEQVRAFTRDIEFDYVRWTIEALGQKISQSSLGTAKYLSLQERHRFVRNYLDLVTKLQQDEARLNQIFADPNVSNPHEASLEVRKSLEDIQVEIAETRPVAESILQEQIGYTATKFGLTFGGQPVPPVLYHNTPLPLALIVSPRDVIRQDADISILPDLQVDDQVELEERVDKTLDVSSLVVQIGGVGVYPTMVQETNNLDWLSEVVAHEWIHNYLTLRPLGINYFKNPELRVMNETTAAIAGKEIGRAVLEEFYPELAPAEPQPSPEVNADMDSIPEPPVFDFRREMHTTRLAVDKLLEEGKIDEAEEYMEMRRKIFWDHGYQLRKLNQAYFAFHGAYADEPGGAAGAAEDPVGEAVRKLRAQSPSLAAFLNRISWMTSFDQLQRAVNQNTKS